MSEQLLRILDMTLFEYAWIVPIVIVGLAALVIGIKLLVSAFRVCARVLASVHSRYPLGGLRRSRHLATLGLITGIIWLGGNLSENRPDYQFTAAGLVLIFLVTVAVKRIIGTPDEP
mgnify:CR=1 FL=1